jgi:UDP-N-acetylglucosamine 2-epimerase
MIDDAIIDDYVYLMKYLIAKVEKRDVLQVLVSGINVAQLFVFEAGKRFAVEDPDFSKKLLEIHDKLGEITSELIETFKKEVIKA